MKRKKALLFLPTWITLALITLDVVIGQEPTVFNHDAQHCVDVSVWGDVEFRDQDCDKCETVFNKVCDPMIKEVCDDVPFVRCEVVPYTDCEMYMEQMRYNETEVITEGVYTPWVCQNVTREETHIKLVPRCVKVTRQDCVTKWRVTSNGEKVWDGNELCTPVMWQNCTLHEEEKRFNQTYTECRQTGTPIPTMQCVLTEKVRMATGMRCTVKHSLDCQYSQRQECVRLQYQECHEEAAPLSCRTSTIRAPFQPKIHRVKCLLRDDNDQPRLSAEQSAREAEQKLSQGGENTIRNINVGRG